MYKIFWYVKQKKGSILTEINTVFVTLFPTVFNPSTIIPSAEPRIVLRFVLHFKDGVWLWMLFLFLKNSATKNLMSKCSGYRRNNYLNCITIHIHWHSSNGHFLNPLYIPFLRWHPTKPVISGAVWDSELKWDTLSRFFDFVSDVPDEYVIKFLDVHLLAREVVCYPFLFYTKQKQRYFCITLLHLAPWEIVQSNTTLEAFSHADIIAYIHTQIASVINYAAEWTETLWSEQTNTWNNNNKSIWTRNLSTEMATILQ